MSTPSINAPTVVRRISLHELTGEGFDIAAISDVGVTILHGMYEPAVIEAIGRAADALAGNAGTRFLRLCMLRAAHRAIRQVHGLVNSRDRLRHLSAIAGVALEPYPIDVAASHINYYGTDKVPIDFHSDGAAIVELIPLDSTIHERAGTLVYRGPRDEGSGLLSVGKLTTQSAARVVHIQHRPGDSILLQGRRLLHAGAPAPGNRKLLVIAMRSVDEPWKDDNTIARLAMDYDPSEFLEQWIQDELARKLPAFRRFVSGDGTGPRS